MKRRTRLRRAALAAAAALLVVPAAALPSGASPVTAEVDDVQVRDGAVSFTVDAGAVPGGEQLDPGSITVKTGDVSWPASAVPVDASNSTVPRRAVMVVDTSGSMGDAGIADARTAARAFLDTVPADVTVGLITFAELAQLVVEPTSDRQAVGTALDTMRPGGDTALYDGIILALQTLGTDGDRALVVLSDGEDTASTATFEATRDALAAAGVQVHLVGFRTQDAQIDVLNQLAAPAGGVVLEARGGRELANVFASSARTLVNKVLVTAEIPDDLEPGDVPIVISLAAGGTTVTATTNVTIASPPPVAPTAEPVAAPAGTVAAPDRPWMQPGVVVAAFVAMFVLFLVVLAPSTWRASVSERRSADLQRYGLTGVTHPGPTAIATPSAVSAATLAWAERRMENRQVQGSWQTLLERAAMPLKPHEWLLIRLGAVALAIVVGIVLLPWWLLTAPVLGLVTWLLTGLFLKLKATRRARRFADELPDVLQLVAGSLSSGFSFAQAVDNAATDGQDPIAGELSRALAESRLGVQLEDSLEHVATRMDSTDLSWTVMAVRISREVGGNLADVLLSTAETMRERGRVRRQVKALSAEGRLSAIILILLPLAIAGWMAVVRPEYLAPLVTHPLGIAMTVFAVLSMTFGAWWMSRLVKLEV